MNHEQCISLVSHICFSRFIFKEMFSLGSRLWSWDQDSEFSVGITKFSLYKKQDPLPMWHWLCSLTLTEFSKLNYNKRWQEQWDKYVQSGGRFWRVINDNASFTAIIFKFKHALYIFILGHIRHILTCSQLEVL